MPRPRGQGQNLNPGPLFPEGSRGLDAGTLAYRVALRSHSQLALDFIRSVSREVSPSEGPAEACSDPPDVRLATRQFCCSSLTPVKRRDCDPELQARPTTCLFGFALSVWKYPQGKPSSSFRFASILQKIANVCPL